jgi:hypothetical protein
MRKRAKRAKRTKRTPSPEQMRRDILTKLAVPLWPHTGWALGVGRSLTYEGAESGVIPTIEGIGRRKPVPTSWLRPKVGLGEPPT